jgi:hypothetical protein
VGWAEAAQTKGGLMDIEKAELIADEILIYLVGVRLVGDALQSISSDEYDAVEEKLMDIIAKILDGKDLPPLPDHTV